MQANEWADDLYEPDPFRWPLEPPQTPQDRPESVPAPIPVTTTQPNRKARQ